MLECNRLNSLSRIAMRSRIHTFVSQGLQDDPDYKFMLLLKQESLETEQQNQQYLPSNEGSLKHNLLNVNYKLSLGLRKQSISNNASYETSEFSGKSKMLSVIDNITSNTEQVSSSHSNVITLVRGHLDRTDFILKHRRNSFIGNSIV